MPRNVLTFELIRVPLDLVTVDGCARQGELHAHARVEAFDDEDVHDPFRSRNSRHT